MTKLTMEDNLAYVSAIVSYQGHEVVLARCLIDTGSVGTLFSVDQLSVIGLVPSRSDMVQRIHGVGGDEFVVLRNVDTVRVGELQVSGFEIETGALLYGRDFDGILGMDFLTAVGAVIDLERLELRRSDACSSAS